MRGIVEDGTLGVLFALEVSFQRHGSAAAAPQSPPRKCDAAKLPTVSRTLTRPTVAPAP